MRYTLAPILGRMMWPLLMRKIFGPNSMPAKFRTFPKEMALRPWQVRASAAESALMIPNAVAFSGEYLRLQMPVVIVSGDHDRVINIDDQSARLHEELPQSTFHRVRGAGHMIHQTNTAAIMSAIAEAAAAGLQSSSIKELPRAA